MVRRSILLTFLAGLLSWVPGIAVSAASNAAATLLIPYFEVDLDDAEGPNTHFSIGNAGEDPLVAHVVLWTDWSSPTLAFDVLLEGNELRPINLRQLFAEGRLPISGTQPGSLAGFPGCKSPLSLPPLELPQRAILRAQHTGAPHPENGLCFGSARAEAALAIGFVTVDIVNDCSDTLLYPSEEDYFEPNGTGRASNENLLWGDYFLIDPSESSAQGLEAIGLRADPSRSGPEAQTFYATFSANDHLVGPEDSRAPVGCRSRTRFLRGGGFDGGTDLIVWSDFSFRAIDGRECGTSDAHSTGIQVAWRSEAGATISDTRTLVDETMVRIEVGIDPWNPGIPFGSADVSTEIEFFWWNPPGIVTSPVQSLVVPVYRASNLYSVALQATTLQDECD
ncbi:MAG: hypothetical protein K8J08_08770 [Thermoanaerobaculia bacterium]|nr:hypothetical protein [Thermoanaerobaculia bacterium]